MGWFVSGAVVSGLVSGVSHLTNPTPQELADYVENSVRDVGLDTEADLVSEPVDVDSEQFAVDTEANNMYNAERRIAQLKKDVEQGKAFETKAFAEFKTAFFSTESQITIVTASKTKVRLDAIGLDADGNVVIGEFKSSATARLTRNQKKAFNEMQTQESFVGGKGKGKFTGGMRIAPVTEGTKIIIQRPAY